MLRLVNKKLKMGFYMNKVHDISELSGAMLRALQSDVLPDLSLSEQELFEILGFENKDTFETYLSDAERESPLDINQNQFERLSLFIGIYRALKMSSPDHGDAVAHFFKQPNVDNPFDGHSALEFLLKNNSKQSLQLVRNYFESKCV